jgi:hypothetical protein
LIHVKSGTDQAEFVTLKQKWQQQKGVSYEQTEGQQIVPGFVGRSFK